MSFILDEIQQQHLLVILNDINRHIYEANQTTAIGSTNGGSGTGGTSNGTQPKGGKGLGGGARHPKRLVSVDHLPQALPDLITGFNHTNKQPLTDFIINTNRYFRAFFKFTAILIGTNNNSNNTNDNTNDINTKGKHVLLWLSRFYNKLLLEHLNFEYIFDVTPDLLVSADLGLVVPPAPPPPPQPSNKKDHHQNQHQQHLQQQQQHQQHQHLSHKTGTKVILNGTSVQVIPVSSGTGGPQQQQQGQGSILIHPKEELELMTRAVHLHELHQLQNASTSTNPTQQVYLIDPQSSPHQQQQQIQQQQQQHQQQQQLQQQQQQQQELEFIQQQQQLENHLLSYQVSGQIIKDLTFLVLLIIYLFYKLRFIFPNLTGRFEISWKFFLNFERELDPSFLYDNFIEFIQLELCQQRAANEKRTDSLKQEVLQLEKIAKIVDKEIESEIGRLVHLQSRQQQQQQNQIQNLQNQNQQPNLSVPQQKQILGSQVHQRNSNSGPTVQLSTGSGSGTISLIDLKGLKLASTSSSNSLGITISGGGGANGPMPSSSSLASPAISTGNGSLSGRACPECGKVFRNTYKLNRHLYVHKDPSEKPYVCDWTACSYRSISRNDLNRHKMIHTGEKPYLCEIEGCEKRYSRPDKLRHHKQTVHFKDSAKKEQICIYPGCNFQCVTKSELNRHQQGHEKDEKMLKQQVQVVQQVVAHAQKSNSNNSAANQAAQAIVSAATAAATLQGVLSKDGQEYVVPISISTTPDISSIVTQQQQQHLVHHQHLNQQQSQQQQQQQHQITVPLSMLTGNQTNSLSQLMAQHPGLNISGLTDSRLAAAAVAAVQQQQSQQQQNAHAQQNAHGQQNAHQVNSLSSLISGNANLPEGSQVVIVPSSSANQQQQQQLHNQTLSAISSIPISAVVSSNNNNNSGSVSLAVSGTGNNPQRLNTVSVWST